MLVLYVQVVFFVLSRSWHLDQEPEGHEALKRVKMKLLDDDIDAGTLLTAVDFVGEDSNRDLVTCFYLVCSSRK